MREAVGNAGRDGELAWVRLSLEGDRIAAAEGEGPGVAALLREVVGRSTLDAAAVPGTPLATDALADALGPVVRAPAPRRGRARRRGDERRRGQRGRAARRA